MKYDNLGGYSSINKYVEAKLEKFSALDKTYETLFEMMFSERENVMLERTDGYKIIKTTYGSCRESILRRATTLKEILKDVPKGSVVGVYLDNGEGFIEMLWCVLICGYRPLLMNMRLDGETLEKALSRMGAAAVISCRTRR